MSLDTKMTIRVPEAWHRRIKSEAALRGLTVSSMIKVAVDEWLERNPIKEGNNDGRQKR